MTNSVYLYLVCFTTLLLFLLELYIYKRVKNKGLMHKFFTYAILSIGITNVGYIFLISLESFYNYYETMFFVYIIFIGASFFPVFFLLFGLSYTKQKFYFVKKCYLLFIIPILTNIILWTNDYHHLFYTEYISSCEYIYGPYFIIHVLSLYIYVLIGISNLLYFSIKNAGFFSKQAILIVLGTVIPLILDVIWILGSILNSDYLKMFTHYDITPITFGFAIFCYALAIFKFDFLNIVPIALQRIVDIISDSFIVVDEEYNVIDFNKTFIDTFENIYRFKRKDNIIEVLEKGKYFDIDPAVLIEYFKTAVSTRESIFLENHFKDANFDKYFKIEITPVFSERKKRTGVDEEITVKLKRKNTAVGIVILLKDITDHIKNIEAIKEQQEILLEQERLASLGQLIGGIAHNLKTPIMSISGGIEALKDLTYEYRDSIGDRSVTDQDHKEIAREMMSWLDKMKPYCSYMSDVISAVKGQAVQIIASGMSKFTVDEAVKRVELLLKHELKKYHCLLKVDSHIDMSTEIKGEVNNLVQVFDNIIINAIQAYEGQNGVIELCIVRSGDSVEFTFKDYGSGIPEKVADRLFKEMVTTKGKNGTGLGLYMSYSTVKGRFGGNMSFTTRESVGTTFYVSLPCITYGKREAE